MTRQLEEEGSSPVKRGVHGGVASTIGEDVGIVNPSGDLLLISERPSGSSREEEGVLLNERVVLKNKGWSIEESSVVVKE